MLARNSFSACWMAKKSIRWRKRKVGNYACGMAKFRWTAADDALLGTATDAEVAKRIGITMLSVFKRRQKLGIPPHQRQTLSKSWGLAELGLLGQYPDEQVAELLKRPVDAVRRKRIQIGR